MLEFTLPGNAYFDGVSQPVLLVQDGQIKYYNPAAKELFAQTANAQAWEPWAAGKLPQEAGAVETLELGGEPWAVHTQPVGEGLLCLFQPLGQEQGLSRRRLGDLAVQLRLLLGTLSVSIETLQTTLVETEQARNERWIAHLNHSYHQLLRLVDNLDFYNQSDEDLSILYPPAVLDLSGLCRELEHILSYLAEQTGHRFSYEERKQGLLVWANEYLLRRLVYNLTANALEAGGDMTLRLERKGNSAALTLEDTGGGIPPEKLPLLFLPAAERPMQTALQGGVGLGLPICQRIAHLYGGRVMASPKKKGAALSLALPLCTGEQAKLLRSEGIFLPEQSYNQVLTELSGVLPAKCYGQESVF